MLQACDDDDDTTGPDGDGNLAEVVQGNDNLSQFSSALEDAELLANLEGDSTRTVFAPTNNAFNQLPSDLSSEQLTEVLSYHIVNSEINTGNLEEQQTISSQAGSLFVTTQNGTVNVNDSATVQDNLEASNGIVHTVDRVLLPDTYSDVVGIITKRYNLQMLQDSLSQTGLADTLRQDTQNGYTVFAPTNSAFENADMGDRDLQNVLSYHVLPEGMTTAQLSSGSVETVSGDTLQVSVSGDTVTLTDETDNSATVTTADLEGTNGVVHIIDGLLLPAAQGTTQ